MHHTRDSTVVSDACWKHEQDYTADLVRQMDFRCRAAGPDDPIRVYQSPSLLFRDVMLIPR